ncbi:MAG: amino acid ABC transporter permease [Celeribacter sp.]|jgi:general L-amino acid transport system permease protein
MEARTLTSYAVSGAAPARPAPATASGLLRWLHANLFNGVHNWILTGLGLWLLIATVPDLLRWSLIDAVWTSDVGSDACRASTGACWAVIGEKYRLMLFGTYPYDQHWRGALVVVLLVGMSILSGFRKAWSRRLVYGWIAVWIAILTLQLGGVFGLEPTPSHLWGGLPLTLLMFFGTVIGGLPMAVLLALGRQSDLPVIKALCVGFIEVVRGVPLVTVLFMAALIFPLFVPETLTPGKFVRAQIGMLMFFAAYAAEIFRGGFQAIPRGQYEAANALGLSYWSKTVRIILPQTVTIVLPALMNDIIRAFKNTTFIAIVGLFDILGATKSALEDPIWVTYSTEAYLFVTALYFLACFSMSKYSEALERDLNRGKRR